MYVHAKTKEISLQTSKGRNKGNSESMQRTHSKIAKQGQTKHAKHVKGQTRMLLGKRGCPKRINAGLDRMSTVPLDWSMDGTSKQRLMHEHVGKCVKRIHISKESQMGGIKKA